MDSQFRGGDYKWKWELMTTPPHLTPLLGRDVAPGLFRFGRRTVVRDGGTIGIVGGPVDLGVGVAPGEPPTYALFDARGIAEERGDVIDAGHAALEPSHPTGERMSGDRLGLAETRTTSCAGSLDDSTRTADG